MKILFVCTGNICRSPTAHGLFLSLVHKNKLSEYFEVDSAGTHSWNIGSPPDPFSQKTAKNHGIDISALRARRVLKEDYDYYDFIVAMDASNMTNMLAVCGKQNRHKLKLLLEYADNPVTTEIPDPYGDKINGFETVYALIEQGCLGLLRTLKIEMNDNT